ncbi:hypothetical protein ACLX1H_006393 [Fusarium chlamydosporum]
MSQNNRQLPDTPTDDNRHLDSKGKGKGKDAKGEEPSPITNRIQASCRLALNAFGSGPDLSGQQPAGKAGPSGSNRDTNTIGRLTSSTGEASSQKLRSTAQGETVRLKPNLDSGAPAKAFDDFVSSDFMLDDNNNASSNEKARDQLCRLEAAFVPVSEDASEQEKLDGAAVVSLLDNTSDELDTVLLGAQDPTAEDGSGALTPEAAAKLREALFSTNMASSDPRLDNLLNFNPGFLDQPGTEAELERQLYLGTKDTDEARSSWLQQWGNVLSGYTDHVWGDLVPLIAEARNEIEESGVQGTGALSQTKALDRLRQVLAH